MENELLNPIDVSKRLNSFRDALALHGVPNAVYDEYPGQVLINLGGPNSPFGAYVQCWVSFRWANAVEFHFRGGDVLIVPPERRLEALTAINDINGKEWWANAFLTNDNGVVIKNTFWLDDTSCGEPCFLLLRDLSQVLIKYREHFM